MMKLGGVLVASMLIGACGNQPAAPPPATLAAPAPQPYSTLAQMMRGIPFPASNIIFDTQSEDPGLAKKSTDGARGATASFSSVYGGWQAVENNALAIAETANLLMIPGRLCENGRPVPLEREDFKKFAAGLADGRRRIKPHNRRISTRWWKSAAPCLTRARPVTRSIATRMTSSSAASPESTLSTLQGEADVGSGTPQHVRRMVETLPLVVTDLWFEHVAGTLTADNSRQ
jgi:hypothetical protein